MTVTFLQMRKTTPKDRTEELDIRITANPTSWSIQRIMYSGINSTYFKFITFNSKEFHCLQACSCLYNANSISYKFCRYTYYIYTHTPNFIYLSLTLHQLSLSNRDLAALPCITKATSNKVAYFLEIYSK